MYMAFTRFNYDEGRTKKLLQESTDPGRYVLNVPGPGASLDYVSDPHIRLTKWGGNLRSNTTQLESDLKGLTRQPTRDNIKLNQYQHKAAYTSPLYVSTNPDLTTGQSRTTHPAWRYRGHQRESWSYLPLNPQEHVCIPFQNNLSSRLLEKDYYTPGYLYKK